MSIQRFAMILAVLCSLFLAGAALGAEEPLSATEQPTPEAQASAQLAVGAPLSLEIEGDCEAAANTSVLPTSALFSELGLANEAQATGADCGGWTFHFCCSGGSKKFQSRQCTFPGESPWTEYKCSGVCPM